MEGLTDTWERWYHQTPAREEKLPSQPLSKSELFQRLGCRRKGTDMMMYKIQVKTPNFLLSVSMFPVGQSIQVLLLAET